MAYYPGINVIRVFAIIVAGLTLVLVLVTLRHYTLLYRMGKEMSPPLYVFLIRVSHALALGYQCLDLADRVRAHAPPNVWRMVLIVTSLALGLPGAIGILRYVSKAQWKEEKRGKP